MRKIYFLSLIVALVLGCKKDDDSSDENLENTKYANKTVTENKEFVENTGVSMVSEMKGLNQEKGMEAAVNLLTLMDEEDDANFKSVQTALKSLKTYQETNNVKNLLVSLRSNETAPGIIENFNKITGIYSYNFDTKELDSIAGSSEIVIKFPASKTAKDSRNLNGTLTIQKPQVQTGTFTYDDLVVKELPTLVSFDIKVDGQVGLTYTFTGKYDSKGVPTNVTSTLTIGTFEFKAAFNYSTSASDVNYSIKHSSKTIIDVGAGVNGNFDKTNIENAYHNEYEKDYRYNWETNSYEEYTDTVKVVDPEKILYKANAHFQFMNLKIAGQIDFKDLYVNQKAISDKVNNNQITEEDGEKQLVDLINKDMALIVVYADNNTMIAQAEAYMKVESGVDDWGYSYTDKSIDLQMIFADKSKNSLDSYFKEGFSDFVNETNTFISELNTKYGWDIQPVEDPATAK